MANLSPIACTARDSLAPHEFWTSVCDTVLTLPDGDVIKEHTCFLSLPPWVKVVEPSVISMVKCPSSADIDVPHAVIKPDMRGYLQSTGENHGYLFELLIKPWVYCTGDKTMVILSW